MSTANRLAGRDWELLRRVGRMNLTHELRWGIVTSLYEHDEASPKELAELLGVPLENVSYHVRALRDGGVLELSRRCLMRGAIQSWYRLAGPARRTLEEVRGL